MGSSTVIEEGQGLWVMAGISRNKRALSSTQIVRPGQPTVWGPNMTEETTGQCSATLGDWSVMVTGGQRRSNLGGSDRTEVYNFTSQQWTNKTAMTQRRARHSCTNVWLDPYHDSVNSNGIITTSVTNRSVLSVVVAGGNLVAP